MIRKLADPYPSTKDVPFWQQAGWTRSRRASTGTDRTGSEGGSGEGEDSSESEGDEDEESDEEDEGSAGENASAAELESMRRRMQAADKAKSDAEKKLQDIADKDKSELELATQKVTKLTEVNGKLQDEIGRLRMENAFANVTGVEWRKPATALRVAQAEGYFDEVTNEDGSVDQKKFARKVAEFAKANPELLKSGSTEEGTGKPATGGGVGTGKKTGGGKQAASDADLRSKYRNVLR